MSQNREKKRKFDIPIWRKANLSIEEAAAYSGIRMIKRKAFDEYIERQYSI